MALPQLDDILWAAGLLGNCAVLAVVLRKSLWRQFPTFAALATYQIIIFFALNAVHHFGSKHAYFLGYWITAFADYIFQVALIVEIARAVLSPMGDGWVRETWKPFLLWGSLGATLAAALAFTLGSSAGKGLDLWQVRVSVFTSLLTCELFLAMSAAANRLGLPWRSHTMSIGQGLTIWATAALVGDLGHVILGWNRQFAVFDYIYEFAYVGVLVFWAVALWLPEKERAPLSPEMQDYLLALHRRVQYDLGRTRSVNKPL